MCIVFMNQYCYSNLPHTSSDKTRDLETHLIAHLIDEEQERTGEEAQKRKKTRKTAFGLDSIVGFYFDHA